MSSPTKQSKSKSKSAKPTAKSRRFGLLGAFENLQRGYTIEDIHKQFDRLADATRDRISPKVMLPCQDHADTLKSCFEKKQKDDCFTAMEAYRNCITQATQDRVDELALTDTSAAGESPPPSPPSRAKSPTTPPPPAEPMKPRQMVITPTERKRVWWKPWTWLR